MRFRHSGFVVLVAALAFVASACDLSAWSMFGHGPAHTSYNPTESTIGVGNVGTLHEAWTAVLPGPHGFSAAPATANGLVYATTDEAPYKVEAFDAHGVAGCSGTPRTCKPRWTATTAGSPQSVQVTNGLMYVTIGTGKLLVFGADGVRGCKGTPKTCTALWSASGISFPTPDVPPAITSKFVYATTGNRTSVFDAAGVKGCSGTPKTCKPLWSVAGSSPAVANGVLYTRLLASAWEVHAYDAAGRTGCQGTPKTCTPLWVGRTGQHAPDMGPATAPTVSGGLVWIGVRIGIDDARGALVGFDATGHEGCAGTPKICSPIWNAPTYAVVYPAAVANGVVYALEYFHSGGPDDPGTTIIRMGAYGLHACHTTTVNCSPLWTASLGGMGQGLAVAKGVVYVTTYPDRQIAAYDAAGNQGCSGTPRACVPVWHATVSGSPTAPAVANGVLYIASDQDNILHAYEPDALP